MDKSGDPGLFGRWFRGLSLRAWLIVGFMMALLPVALLSAFWYLDYRDQLREPFRQVLHTQHKVSLALERIQGNLWDIATDVNDFAQTGDESYRDRFETAERDIAANLCDLEMITETYPSFDPVLEGVRQQWTLLLEAASNVSPLPGGADQPLMRFESVIGETGKRVESIAESMRLLNEESHRQALETMERLDRFAAIAGVLALVFSGIGIFIIDQALIRSTDKLVEGAMLVAGGTRNREIEVQVPPELASVAQAFNTMLKQINQQEDALSAAARADGLTGLYNRREFDRALDEAIAVSKESGEPFSLLMIDVDHFKQFNDTHGHLAGDDALRQVADTIELSARENDRAYRYGGEEFAMILPGLRTYEATAIAERLCNTIAAQTLILPDGQKQTLTVSIGISVFSPRVSPPNIIELADRALYAAKMEGRNQVKVTG
ncbi:GGDEF domain-containing protein [Martelella mediterranea]|uniref:diguanylate cyclase n=1 Tax=Martelella mediterranea DSM 17316 TaxID=1122214 RepID=A0A1U9Z7A1_9HYPH|nr:diguanylate cyclase [Martelella mediterranea]AQZ53432.1 Diguanylate cyclase DosC [Martelella mediterranea DSM 17316]